MRLLVVICLLAFGSGFAQVDALNMLKLDIEPTEIAPNIDGVIEDDFWSKIPFVSGFKQTTPKPGQRPTYQTEVKLTYDDEALYVAARMYDNPDSMYVFLTERDQIGNSDLF